MIVKADKSQFENYLSDAANINGDCDKVYFPETKEDVIQIFKEANNKNEKVTISASRTGLTGGSIPENGALISTEKLNKILSVDLVDKNVIVEPGVLLSDLQQFVESKRLFYPPDPTEINSSIGGNVSTNASGARTFKYGSTRDYVEEIELILPTGKELNIKRGEYFFDEYKFSISLENSQIEITLPNYEMPKVKHAAGYFAKNNMDLIDLFIGAEGTLGLITKIKLKLIDLPVQILSMIVFFEAEENSFSFIDEIKQKCKDEKSKINLREIEFFDCNTLNVLKSDYPNIPENSKSAVWIEQEIEGNEDEILEEIISLIVANKGNEDKIWFAIDEKDRDELRQFRHAIALKVNDIISARGLKKVGTDNAVPDQKFSEFYYFTCNLIKQNDLDYVVYGHIGNSHLHFNMLPKTSEELKLSRELYGKICEFSVKLGGTISAEHGIGKFKREYLLAMFGENNILQMAKLKKTIDPNMILNINNIFEEKYLSMI